ncbi:membrane protein YczE [Nocardioides massiliensis]|uniref:Membrane protein YczE n=1 Tax=Nocardioides massiliensis TaxID=1325935 RepID=A0ABT9NQ56_9ACTN|nr:hypothetical protein [Nocardioides massiliensis]MDP9822523.1 putative membrane protein YczE [Nocardioides massiliensis]
MSTLADLGPVAQLRAGVLPRRLVQLVVGLVLYGVSLAMMLRSTLGLAPWDVLHSGLTGYVPLTIGQVVIVMSFVVLLLWIPLREKPGLGTVANALLVGLSADATLAVLAEPSALWTQVGLLVAGVVLNGLATAMYIGSQLGRGPRDGLMTGLARSTGWSLRLVRTGIEVTVVVIGWLIGGIVGLGTVVYALAIGPIAQWALPWFVVRLPGAVPPVVDEDAPPPA